MLATSLSSYFLRYTIHVDTKQQLYSTKRFDMCNAQSKLCTICMMQNWSCKNANKQFIILKSDSVFYTLFPPRQHSACHCWRCRGWSTVVIIGVLLCVLVMRKVHHAATKSQSKLCTSCFFFSQVFYRLIYLCTKLKYDL